MSVESQVLFYNHDGQIASSNFDDQDESRAWIGPQGYAAIDHLGNLYKVSKSPSILQTASFTLSSAHILSGNPVTIVPAQGLGQTIIPVQTFYNFFYGTTPYTGAGAYSNCFYGSDAGISVDVYNGTVPGTAPTLVGGDDSIPLANGNAAWGNTVLLGPMLLNGATNTPPPDTPVDPASQMSNMPIVWVNGSGVPYVAGDGTMKVTVCYYVIDNLIIG